MKKRLLILSAICVVLVLALAGCSGNQGGSGTSGGTSGSSGGTSGSTTGATVTEKGFAFDPAKLEVSVGDTVTFTNEDSATHNVEIDGQQLGQQNQGQSVTWKATKAGSFPYKCIIHPSMTGEITVK